MNKSTSIFLIAVSVVMMSCMENYSNGERIGLVTQFSKRGMIYKTWEGHLNITQTGMNSADGFDFSIDRKDKKNSNDRSIPLLDSAASLGWKVKLIYHETMNRNWFNLRGETSHFIDSVIVIDKNFSNHNSTSGTQKQSESSTNSSGRVVDTIYIVITPNDPNYKKFFK